MIKAALRILRPIFLRHSSFVLRISSFPDQFEFYGIYGAPRWWLGVDECAQKYSLVMHGDRRKAHNQFFEARNDRT
jgi:hypothetical protein